MRLLLLMAFIGCAVPLAALQVKLGEPGPAREEERARAVERAKAHLAESLKLPEKEIELESAKETKWPDASLGCPEKDHMYAQMVTSGWTVVLKAQGRAHEVHVAGKRAVSCSKDPARGDTGQ